MKVNSRANFTRLDLRSVYGGVKEVYISEKNKNVDMEKLFTQ